MVLIVKFVVLLTDTKNGWSEHKALIDQVDLLRPIKTCKQGTQDVCECVL